MCVCLCVNFTDLHPTDNSFLFCSFIERHYGSIAQQLSIIQMTIFCLWTEHREELHGNINTQFSTKLSSCFVIILCVFTAAKKKKVLFILFAKKFYLIFCWIILLFYFFPCFVLPVILKGFCKLFELIIV